ncbi:MAG: GAF domain-containing protein [Chloroflexi bacterium]|nr:GAF domain-containing protein [Chloroflexota bacterium]
MLNSIRSRLRFTNITLAIGPLLLVTIALFWQSYTIQREQSLILQHEVALRVATEVDNFIDNLERQMVVASQTNDLVNLSTTEQREILGKLRATESSFVELLLLDENGMEQVHKSYLEVAADQSLISRANNDEFTIPTTTKETYFSPITFKEPLNVPEMTIALPLVDRRTDSVEAVMVAVVQIKEIWELIGNIEVTQDETVYIIDAMGTVVAHRNPSVVIQGKTFTPKQASGLIPGLDGATVVLATEMIKVGDQELTVVAERPILDALSLAFTTFLISAGIILVAFLFALGLGLMLTNRIVGPIQALGGVAQAIRGGDLSQKAEHTGLIELDHLADTFNQMTLQVGETLEVLEQRVAERTQALKSSADVSRHLSTILDQAQLLAVVVERLQADFGYYHAFIYLFDEKQHPILSAGTVKKGEGRETAVSSPTTHSSPKIVAQAAKSNRTIHASSQTAKAWHEDKNLPDANSALAVPISRGTDVLGILYVLHQHADGFYAEDLDLVESIANQLAIALQNAQTFENLIEEKLAEAQRKEQAERQLETFRQSPMGRAESFMSHQMAAPNHTFVALLRLAQTADQDSEAASLISNLPQVSTSILTNGSAAQQTEQTHQLTNIAALAEGFNFILTSQNNPELMRVGLRHILSELEAPILSDWSEVKPAKEIYRLCQHAFDVNGIDQITELDFEPLSPFVAAETETTSMVKALLGLKPTIDALNASERVDTDQDKIAYLVTAVEQLRRSDRTIRTDLAGVDQRIMQRISEKWMNNITGAMIDLQTQAQIVCELLTRHTWNEDIVTLTLVVRNQGRGTAVNLRISIMPSPTYTVLDEVAHIEQLAFGEEQQLTLHIRPRLDASVEQFRARFLVHYVDPRGVDQIENFADIVYLLVDEGEFQYIRNPYVVGTPLEAGSDLFFGRESLIDSIQENLAAAQQHNLVLIGQRRMGKTSLLKQLSLRLSDIYIPIYLDGQVMGFDPGMANFFLTFATEIAFALEDQSIDIEPPDLETLIKSPANTFEYDFLATVLGLIGDRHLLILFDEFEELESAVKRGHLDRSIFGYLRHLMQHTEKLSFIFCGTHRLEELAADYWSVLFNISLYQHVGNLTQEEVLHLIQDPVRTHGMRYDDLALDKLWRLTSGHPYFLQLLCHSLVNLHNKSERNYATIADVNTALEEILTSGEAHFIYLWNESTPAERLALFALSRIMPLTSQMTPVQVIDYLTERGVTISKAEIRDALHHLTLRDILKTDASAGSGYRWQVGLLGFWVEKYKSVGRVMDEVR